ncbi:uncharacterized protein TRIVIDRAFT_225878 [Trichoderma virens Gv29-8]|uniref:Core Histone H2A/H2B/H3 domain-containing protein n=1 Tax=Hypocrea virens (strain Gv29-8 / FGSC 10586) TaxID=413071 RepID=G9N4Q6_HYPVG|nr:uncharacterized protein TRIVIDRAFT_225878 [Trichoderma virens Gv29-8]EHK18580.1 hypothetical protein TRIVIDRAFT_225878 [Trichoderma virens Gv29-8]UKZ52787.1 hypothetical protein TrVGV298_006574 [Trichoderma virens]
MARIKQKAQKPVTAKPKMAIAAEGKALRAPLQRPKFLQRVKHRSRPLRRFKLSDMALQKMRKYRTKSLLLPETAFMRLARDIAHEALRERLSFTNRALEGLQASCEQFTISYFTVLRLCADHAMRKTILLEDSNLVKGLMGVTTPTHPICEKPE